MVTWQWILILLLALVGSMLLYVWSLDGSTYHVRGKELDRMARLWGFSRKRWEIDILFRRRIYRQLTGGRRYGKA